MKDATENIRKLTDNDNGDIPHSSITVWLDEITKTYELLCSALSAAHKRVDELEEELSKAICTIEESGVDYDEIVEQIEQDE